MIRIKSNLSNRYITYFATKKIRKFLYIVPKEHLIGLDTIVIWNTLSGNNRNYPGIYCPKYAGRRTAYMELAINTVYNGKPLLLFMPFIGNLLLSSVIYHEIGHHYHYRLKHNVNKRRRENFADKYRNKMLEEALSGWLSFFRLRPIAPFIKIFVNRYKSQ